MSPGNDEMNAYEIAWIPEDASSKLAQKMGTRDAVSFPHYVQARAVGPTPGFERSAKTLALGILLADLTERYVTLPTHVDLASALLTCCADFKVATADELCVHAAAFLRERHGDRTALAALRRARLLLGPAELVTGDLIVALVREAQVNPQEADLLMVEAADLFTPLANLDRISGANRAEVLRTGQVAIQHVAQRSTQQSNRDWSKKWVEWVWPWDESPAWMRWKGVLIPGTAVVAGIGTFILFQRISPETVFGLAAFIVWLALGSVLLFASKLAAGLADWLRNRRMEP